MERYDVIGVIGRRLRSDDPKALAADLNNAGLALIAEFDDNDDDPSFMVAEYFEVKEE